jgi:hypothetical protein
MYVSSLAGVFNAKFPGYSLFYSMIEAYFSYTYFKWFYMKTNIPIFLFNLETTY